MSRPSAGYKTLPKEEMMKWLLNAEEQRQMAELATIIRNARRTQMLILLNRNSRSQRQALN